MPSRFVEVVPDLLYRGGAPDLEEISMLKKEWGINKIISLDRDSGIKIKDECKKNGIKHFIIPIHGFDHEKALKQIDEIGPVALVGDDVTYVHCKWGKDRTGMFIARFRTDSDMPAQQAVQEAVNLGFGLGVDDDSVQEYLDVINNGKYTDKPVSLEEYESMVDSGEHCNNCGMTFHEGKCPNCSKNTFALNFIGNKMKGDAVDKSRYNAPFQNPGGSTSVSDMWSVPEPSPESQAFIKDKMIRRGILKSLQKKLEAQDVQHITKPIGAGEKKKARELIKTLRSFLDLIDILIANSVNKMLDLFKNTEGINYNIMEETKSVSHFKAFGANMKKNIWRLIGARYIDILDDLKPVGMSDEEAEKYKTSFDACVDQLGLFSTDTQIGPMQQTLKDTVRGLADLTIDLGNFMEKNLKDKDFQINVVNILIEVQKQCAKIKSIVQDRIIRKIAKDVIGEDFRESDDKKDVELKTKKE
ncbi:MAG TPA: hypothetical protein VMX17_13280 [Candidatus Glassbacteria bacterium]|nr:hypothetical protein [Candidatus Glassbacteria bacterium]